MHCILQDRLDGDIHSHSRTPKAYSNDEERKEAFVGKIREALNLMRNQLFEVCSANRRPAMLLCSSSFVAFTQRIVGITLLLCPYIVHLDIS